MSHGNQVHPEQRKQKKNYEDKQFLLQQIWAYDQGYDEKELFKHFEGDNCLSLRGKPKIFIIQVRNLLWSLPLTVQEAFFYLFLGLQKRRR